MRPSEYDELDRVEDRMWWFSAMHSNLLMAMRRSARYTLDLPILDAGCGTGRLLSHLAGDHPGRRIVGLDLDFRACTRALVKSAQPVCTGSVNHLPFADAAFGAIFSADVLCHDGVDEGRALQEFHRCLARDGRLILNLPAYEWMLSRHDQAVSNVRRYTATGLRRLLQAVGFHPVYVSYWNALLFPLMVITRKLTSDADMVSDVKLYPRPVDLLCRGATAFEALLLRRGVRFPFGGSILAAAVKAGDGP